MKKNEQYCHMKLGEGIGEILLEIAQTNIRKGDVQKALSTYIESLHGFTEEYVLQILKNQVVLVTSEDGETMELLNDEKLLQENQDNIVDWWSWVKNCIDEFDELRDIRHNIIRDFNKIEKTLDIEDYNINQMMLNYFTREQLSSVGIYNIAAKLIAGYGFANVHSSGESSWDNLVDDVERGEASKYQQLLYYTVKYVATIKQLHNAYTKFANTYEWLEKNGLVEHYPLIETTLESVISILDKFTDTNKGYYHPMCNEQLYDYKNQLLDDLCHTTYGKSYLIDKILQKNIMDGYDAGWLSPDGEFYGENGETSSMIHLRLADQLFSGKYNSQMSKDGVSVYGGSNSPEFWLEKHGWLKIHHDEVYGYFSYSKENDDEEYKSYCPTEKQINLMCKYIDKFYNSMVYTEPTIFGSRTSHKESYKTRNIRQMNKVRLHEIFSK